MAIVVDQLVTEFVAKDGVSGPAKNMGAAIGGMGSPIAATTAALAAFGGAVAVSAASGLVSLGNASVRASADIESLKLGLIAVTGSTEAAEEQFKRLREIAKLPGLNTETAVQSYVDAVAGGLDGALVERALMGFGNALATVGKGAEDLKGAMYGLRQLATSDIIKAEDLNIIVERVPQASKILREFYGTARGEDLTKAGVSPIAAITTLVAGLESLEKATGGTAGAWENFDDAMKMSLATMGNALNTTFTPMLNQLSEGLNRLAVDGGVLDRVGQKWAALFAVDSQNSMFSMLATFVGALEAVPSAIAKIASEVSELIDAIKSFNPARINQAALNYLFWGDNVTSFASAAQANANQIMLQMGIRSNDGSMIGAQMGNALGSPVSESATTNPVVSALNKIERNTRPLLDFRQYVLGDGELGAAGVTPTEIAGLKGMKSRSKVETAVWALVSAIKDDAKIEALKAMGSTKRMGAAH